MQRNKIDIVNAGYASNYTDKTRQSTVDIVLLIGVDNQGESAHAEDYETIKKACEVNGLTYIILGNGKSDVNFDDVNQLPEAHNIVIWGHGIIKDGKHFIALTNNRLQKTASVLMRLHGKTKSKNIILCSCYGGKVIAEIKSKPGKQLHDGTFLTAYSAPDEVSFIKDNSIIISTLIQKTTPGQMTPIIGFFKDIIKTIPQTMVFAYQLNNKLHSETLLRKNRGLNDVPLETKKFCRYQRNILIDFIAQLLINNNSESLIKQFDVEFPDNKIELFVNLIKTKSDSLLFHCNQEFPDSNIDETNLDKIIPGLVAACLSLEAGIQEMEAFQELSIRRYIYHNDVEVMSRLLANKQAQIVTQALLDFAKSNKNPDITLSQECSMMVLLLKHWPVAATLIGPSLRKAHLCEAQLQNATLPYASFIDSNLISANLTNALLTSINLTKSILTDAILVNAELTGANLRETIMVNADCTNANLFDGDLSKANLTNANFTNAILTCANLTKANLTNANLTNAYLLDADLTGVDLTSVKGLNANQLCQAKSLINIKLDKHQINAMSNDEQIKLKNKMNSDYQRFIDDQRNDKSAMAKLLEPSLRRHVLHNDIDVMKSLLENNKNVSFVTQELVDLAKNNLNSDVKMSERRRMLVLLIKYWPNSSLLSDQLNLSHADLIKADLKHFDLTNVDLNYAALDGADLIGAQLDFAHLRQADLTQTDLTGANLELADLTRAILYRANLTNANLKSARLQNANLTDANLTNADLSLLNLTTVKGLTAAQLCSAKSLLGIKINARQLKAMSSDEQVNVKNKMARDYQQHITDKKNDIPTLTRLLLEIINEKAHPLKFCRSIGIDNYSNDTNSYKLVINAGLTALVKSLTADRFKSLDRDTQKIIYLLTDQRISSGSFTSFFADEITPADYLRSAIAQNQGYKARLNYYDSF